MMAWVDIVQCVLVLWILTYAESQRIIHNEFTTPQKIAFEKIAYDNRSARIFVGGVNRLFELDLDLKKLKEELTGPGEDNPQCSVMRQQGYTCDKLLSSMDAHCKALLIDYSNNALINCISLFQGECSRYNLTNINEQYQRIFKPMVANNATASTYAFIAPSLMDKQQTDNISVQLNAMYVGVQYTDIGWERSRVPAFASYNLVTFNLMYDHLTMHKTMINGDSTKKHSFPIFYKYGFSSEGFSYFITVQKESTDASRDSYITKIFRVCQKDQNFGSYTELGLQCSNQGTLYNISQTAHVGKAGRVLAQALGINVDEDVLYVTFSLGPPRSSEPSVGSAICVYPMRNVRAVFTQNIQKCFEGVGNTGPPQFFTSRPCIDSEDKNSKITDNYCGESYQMNAWIDGKSPVGAEAAVVFSKDVLTSLTIHHIYDYTVAFAGTKTGKLIKMTLDTQNAGTIYETFDLSAGEEIKPNMFVNPTNTHLYVMSDTKLMKVALYKCDNYPNCSSCLGSGNPYCGWCSLENKCSLRAECQEYTQALRWLPYKGQTCPSITSVTPQQIQKKQKSTELQLNVSNQPYFSGTYQCVFRYEKNTASYNILTTNTTLPPNNAAGIKCETPEDYKLPPIPTGEDHINMTLAVQIRGREFVSTIFTFFDCSKHESCTKCSMTQFPCTWCIENHQCTHDASVNCRTNHLIHGSSNLGLTATDKVGPLMCPRVQLSVGSIKQDPEDRRKIYVPSGTAKKVTMFGYNLYPFMQDIRCFFSFGQGHDVKARVVDGNIECDDVSFIYSDKSEFLNVQLRINWRMNGSGKELPLDNPTNVQVVVYKCNEMASTCGDCISKNDNFSCGWCKDTKTCTINLQCPATDWLHAGTCPNVEITKFFPLTGPKAGGTKLTILGKNLGIEKKDISGGVSVAGVACNPIEEEYVPPSKIVCRTGRMGDRTAGPVKVVIGREFEDYSSDTFSYVDPVIREIKPGKGPMAGGTRVQLGGSDLDAGSNVHVKIGDIECENINRSQLILSCVTKASITNDSYLVSARFDNQNVSTTLLYEYIMNPNVTGVSPIKGIVSGGIEIHVRGTNLEYVQQAVMVFKEYTPMDRRRRSIKEYYGECIIPKQDEQYMVCYSPKISNNSLPDDRMQGAKFTYGIKLDNIFIDRTINNKEMFTIYPDPEFPEPFERSYQSKIDNYLTIDGKYLNLGFNTSDIVVKIGSGFCNVTSIDKNGNQLNCKPPPPSPSGGNPSIEVFVGRNFTRKVGSLHYEVAEVLPASLIIGLGVGGGVLVIGVVFFVVLWCIKSRENMNMKKKWQIQMDSLEVKVAKECREAFAELQTDMTELTNDQLGQIAIPFWDYRTYCMRVLFPADEDTHPVLRELDVAPDQREQMENGLKQFANLISNRTFLLVFVRTLEGHKKFNMRERVNVASLISVALQTKMEYATDILKTLLAELIEKSVEGKNHPKLLLRRTESIAEKMLTNWFTFLLYKFLKECAGEPLFMLYQAIKQQMSKGPVDSITSEARYSLSEDKLIRQHVDYKPMTVNILDMEQFGQQSHPVKVLDCDTISQVKEKILDAIYKNAPFSSRPTKQQVDLVLLSGQPGDPDFNPKLQVKTILSDIDSSTKVEGDFKRFNTLAHYKVADQACMVLRPKQVPSLPDITVATVKSFDYRRFDNETYGSRSPALSRAATTRGGHGDIEMAGLISGTKTYHLVKQHDQESNKEGDRGSKMVSEIYLTRLLATKGTLQQFVDDLFERIFSTSHRGTCLPLAIKYMFDFLDDQALLHNIQDQDVVHTWKSNSLPLRFWVNVIKNPNFVFDIYKSNIVDSCLSVVAQNFMDSCSMSDHKLSKDSPSSKLLYAKDIPTYKKWVDRYYHDIKMMPAISDQDITAMMNEESRSHSEEFNTSAALYELYKYVEAYNDDLITALEDDEFARNYRLIQKLESVHVAMRGSSSC